MKKAQMPSQHEITVRDRRSFNAKLAKLVARVARLEQAVRTIKKAL